MARVRTRRTQAGGGRNPFMGSYMHVHTDFVPWGGLAWVLGRRSRFESRSFPLPVASGRFRTIERSLSYLNIHTPPAPGLLGPVLENLFIPSPQLFISLACDVSGKCPSSFLPQVRSCAVNPKHTTQALLLAAAARNLRQPCRQVSMLSSTMVPSTRVVTR